jgi:phosphate starvation-inducible PhoH-like protein
MSEKRTTLSLRGLDLLDFLGRQDSNLRRLEDHFPGKLVVRGETMILEGDAQAVDEMGRVVEDLVEWARRGRPVDSYAIDRILAGKRPERGDGAGRARVAGGGPSSVGPKTRGQAKYLEAMRTHDVVFAIGPAGTGKTFLAVVVAVQALQRGHVDRIVLVRPAVEAGEQLGFLPGDLQEKVDPYLRPLYDALTECLGASRLNRLLAEGTIEVAPLAYMRGRTLNHAYVILDEGQNTTLTQMKMFLTRFGEGTRAVVTGDITQIDLTDPGGSGLVQVRTILADIDGVAFVNLEDRDVVRHPLVQRIVAAFANDGAAPTDSGRTRPEPEPSQGMS